MSLNVAAEGRLKRHSKDKPYCVTFFDIPKSTLVDYTCKILEPPYSNPIMLVEVDKSGDPFGDEGGDPFGDEEGDPFDKEGEEPFGDGGGGNVGLVYDVLQATGREHSDCLGIGIGGCHSFSKEGFDRILAKSRAFVFYGSNLEVRFFREHALPAIKSFYQQGGTVLPIGGDCDLINRAFGCRWTQVYQLDLLGRDEHFDCIPTDDALLLLGTDADGRLLVPEEIYIGRASLVCAGKGEALYTPRPCETKRRFLEMDGHIVEEFWYDDETQTILKDKFREKHRGDEEALDEILEAEKRWKKYPRVMATPIAVHLDPDGGGSVVRIGDQLNEDTRMRVVLARLMTTDFHATKEAMKEKTRYRSRYAYYIP